MPNHPTRILIANGDPLVAQSLAKRLTGWGYACTPTSTFDDALAKLETPLLRRPQVLITDLNLPGDRGLELLRRLPSIAPGVVPFVLTGFGKIASAVEAIKLGATDYLTQPVIEASLRSAIERAATQHALLVDAPQPFDAAITAATPRGMVGTDPRILPLYRDITAAASSPASLLICGESGTGKDLVARAVHAAGRAQNNGSLVTLTATALNVACDTSRNAAQQACRKAWASAQGGTLLLSSIDTLCPDATQALLAHLKIQQPASDKSASPVRFIATTRDPLNSRMAHGDFPRPLFDRIAAIQLVVPPLRDCPENIEALALHFLKQTNGRARRECTLTPAAMRALLLYAWPGNVRELTNAIEHAVTLATATAISPNDLPTSVTTDTLPAPTSTLASGSIPALANGWTPTPLTDALLEPERQIIRAALDAHGWNRNAAARDLKIDRTTLYKKIKRFGLDAPGG
ncbi:MAG: sigma 54-interacting transcriptional regulator [Algisphaera sp.]